MLVVKESGLFEADLQKSLNIFTGAGFSVLAENGLGDKIPIGEALKDQIVAKFKLNQYSLLDLPSLYALLLSDQRAALRSFLE